MFQDLEDDDLIEAIFEHASNLNADMVREAHGRGLESELQDIFNRLGDDDSDGIFNTSQQNFARDMLHLFPRNPEYDFLGLVDAEEDASEQDDPEQPDNEWVAGAADQFQDLAVIADDEASASEKRQEAAPVPRLFLYELSSKTQAKRQEVINQSYVNDRFFRMTPGKGMKNGSDSKKIYDLLVALPPVNSTPLLSRPKTRHSSAYSPTKSGNWIPAVKRLVQDCLARRKIPLEHYSSRSVIIGLAKYLEQRGHLPTVVYTIRDTHILCVSFPTPNQPGNVNLQTIHATGNVLFSPSVYGDGNGNTSRSISEKLKLVPGYDDTKKMYRAMRKNSEKIGTLLDSGLDQINFLRAVIEIARYSCGAHLSSLDPSQSRKFPIGIAQMRTSQLLIDGKITTDAAYGLDTSGAYYQSTEAIKEHKAPFGVVTGKDIKNNLIEVQHKIERINEKYHEVYHAQHASATSCYMIPGNKLLRKKLGEEFGSGNESSGGDYSDDGQSTWADQKRELRKVPRG